MLVYDAWATKYMCNHTETFVRVNAQAVSGIRLSMLERHRYREWCPHCLHIFMRTRILWGWRDENMGILLRYYCRTSEDDNSPMPDWLLHLVDSTPLCLCIDCVDHQRAVRHLRPLALQKDPTNMTLSLVEDRVERLVYRLRKLEITIPFAVVIETIGLEKTRTVIADDTDWPVYMIPNAHDASKWAKKNIPELTRFLDPLDICKLDAVHWPGDQGSIASEILESADMRRIIQNKSAIGYIIKRAHVPRATRRLSGEVAVHLLLFAKRTGTLWATLDSFIIRHIVQFY